MEGHLHEIGTPRKSLVDRVVDDLEDQVVKAPRARRADVHARAQPDRLEALEDSDVFSGIGSFSQIKKPCKRATLSVSTVYQKERSEMPFARLAAAARATILRRFSSSISAANLAPSRRRVSDGSGGFHSGSSRLGSSAAGRRPGAQRPSSTPRRSAISPARLVSSKAQIESAVFTCSVPSRATRAGQALRAIVSP